MSKTRTQTWVALIVVPVGLIVFAIAGLWGYMSATAKPLHPNPQQLPSVTLSAPAPKWSEAVKQARQIVRSAVAEQNLPGLSVAIGIGDEIIWAEGFGFANLENHVPVTPNDMFRIGTASQVLTSAGVGLLLHQGRLKLDDVIQKHVSVFPQKQAPITLRQVMGHLAGVPTDDGDEGPLLSKHCERPVDALPFFANDSLLSEPGTAYRFSSYGGILVSAAIEAAANQPFLTFMRQQIFEPLHMDETRADSAASAAADRVTAYFPRFAADPRYGPDPMRDVDYSCYAGASVFVSTPSDLVRFAMAVNRGKLLQPATVELLQTSQRLASGEETGYGLGWDLETVTIAGKPTRMIGHDGESLGGMVASLLTFPDYGMAVSVISNISYADTYSLAVKIAETFVNHGKTPAQ